MGKGVREEWFLFLKTKFSSSRVFRMDLGEFHAKRYAAKHVFCKINEWSDRVIWQNCSYMFAVHVLTIICVTTVQVDILSPARHGPGRFFGSDAVATNCSGDGDLFAQREGLRTYHLWLAVSFEGVCKLHRLIHCQCGSTHCAADLRANENIHILSTVSLGGQLLQLPYLAKKQKPVLRMNQFHQPKQSLLLNPLCMHHIGQVQVQS